MGSSSEWESEGNRVVDSESIASDVESTSSCHCREARNGQPLQGGEYKTRVRCKQCGKNKTRSICAKCERPVCGTCVVTQRMQSVHVRVDWGLDCPE